MENILLDILKTLSIPHTSRYSNDLYNQHPLNNTLWGLSKMLLNYNIQNESYFVENKDEAISLINFPCIVYWGGNLILLLRKDGNNIHYLWNSKVVIITLDKFIKNWSGIFLCFSYNNYSREPNYITHKINDLSIKILAILCVSLLLILTVYQGYTNKIWNNKYNILFFIINILGVLFSFLLLSKQLNIKGYADLICNILLKKHECGSVINSKYSKFFNLFSWAEIGLSYFIINIFILILFNNYTIYICLLNIITLPYTIWSVWCQKYKLKQWCSLCLVVQLLLWSIFILNILNSRIYFSNINPITTTYIILFLILITIIVNRIVNHLNYYNEIKDNCQKFRSLKGIIDVFDLLQKRELEYPVYRYKITTYFGSDNPRRTLFYFTNPDCEPCAYKHKEIDSIVRSNLSDLNIKFIFISFGEKWDDGCRCLIAAYLQCDKNRVLDIFNDWFTNGKYERKAFIRKYKLDIHDEKVESEFSRHLLISKELNLTVTPFLLIDGFVFPNLYKLEDLTYL